AVAEDGDRQAAAARQREGGAHRHARPRADARAAVQAQVVERVADFEVGAGPAERDPGQAGGRARESGTQRDREVVHGDAVPGGGGRGRGGGGGGFRGRPGGGPGGSASHGGVRVEQRAYQQVGIGGHAQVN